MILSPPPRALSVSQSRDVGVQYARNQSDATARLGLVNSQLAALTDLLQSARERVIQAGNTVLSDSDRQAIAIDLEASFDGMLGLANSRGAEGDYLFFRVPGGNDPVLPAVRPHRLLTQVMMASVCCR